MRSSLLGLAALVLVACGGSSSEPATDSKPVTGAPAANADTPSTTATTDSTPAPAAAAAATTDAGAPVAQKDPDICGATPVGSLTGTGLNDGWSGTVGDTVDVRASLIGAGPDAPFELVFSPGTVSSKKGSLETYTHAAERFSLLADALPVGTTSGVGYSYSTGATFCSSDGSGGGASSIAQTSAQVKVTITSRDANHIVGSIELEDGGKLAFDASLAEAPKPCCPKVVHAG